MAHEHGAHVCLCPQCGYETEVEANVKCNTLTCPCCGDRMRAEETGEYRSSRIPSRIAATPAKVRTESVPCAVCHFPIQAPTYVGQQVKCPYCGSINEAISQGVTIPTPLLVGLLSFGAGVLLGPALMASTQSGAEYLAKKARERLA
jgi:hypothetical protein